MRLPPAPGDKRTLVYDMEVYPNWYCISISNGETTATFASHQAGRKLEIAKLADKRFALAGFNNFAYDDILLRCLIADPTMTPQRLHKLSQRVIDPQDEDETEANFATRYSPVPWGYSIDVFQLLNGKGSLKEHACRSYAEDVEETPYDFGTDLPEAGFAAVMRYCQIDVANTVAKLRQLWELVTLRDKLDTAFGLGNRVYCLSEQGIAQATFLKLHRDRSGQNASQIREACRENPDNLASVWAMDAIVSERITFKTAPFKRIHAALLMSKLYRLDDHGSKWELRSPDLPADLAVNLADARFQLGVGGLHSIDAPGIFRATAQTRIYDFDVTSYYPSIIINENLHPKHIGPGFVADMRTLRDRRVAAKKAGDKVTANALKIVVNSTFGKLNDVWSPIRSVPDALRVTIDGQLYLLMLVEAFQIIGARILSANTDGVTIQWGGTDEALAATVRAWEIATGFDLERTDYSMVARRDVNSYIAKTTDGKVKLKGAFQPDTGKGDGLIVKRAAVAYLTEGIPIGRTVRNAKPEELLFYQRCKNGGTLVHGDRALGKLARWYACVDGQPIRRRNPNGTFATLPNAHSAALCFNRDEIGTDIDFNHYVAEAMELVKSCEMT